MQPLSIDAPAKLNLFLHVTGKRPDHFHLLESLVVFTQFGDRLEFVPADHLQLTVTGPFAAALEHHEDNLIMHAARALGGGKRGAQITLHKHIPVGAGLGGGSADAAATLRGLITLWGLDVKDKELQRLALKLGSDVPVCLYSQSAFVSGIGECVSPVGIEGQGWLLLANPGETLLTADVFSRFYATAAAPVEAPRLLDTPELLEYIRPKHNMLEAAARQLCPAIGEVLEAIAATPGCVLARMTGSGATCFGLYDNRGDAEAAARQLQRTQPHWWCMATGLYGKA